MKLAALPPEKIDPKKLQDVLVCFPLCQEKHIDGAPAATRAPFPLGTARDRCFTAGHRHHCQHPLPLVVQRSPVAPAARAAFSYGPEAIADRRDHWRVLWSRSVCSSRSDQQGQLENCYGMS
jgi:hypothetical protein